jgi:hypothetical protein
VRELRRSPLPLDVIAGLIQVLTPRVETATSS